MKLQAGNWFKDYSQAASALNLVLVCLDILCDAKQAKKVVGLHHQGSVSD